MYILLIESDNCPSWINRRERMTTENISWSISPEACCQTWWGSNPWPPDYESDPHPIEPLRLAQKAWLYLKLHRYQPLKCPIDCFDWLCCGLKRCQPLWAFISSPREWEKRDSRGDKREGQGRKRNRNEREETEETKTFPSILTCYKDIALPNCKPISVGRPADVRYKTPSPHPTTPLTLKMPRKPASENIACWIFLQTFQTYFCIQANSVDLIRLLLKEQSDLGPHCLQKWLLKSQADDKADNNCCDWQFKG